MNECTVIGGGLAGSEAAWQLAERGIHVKLYEMRPQVGTGAHTGSDLAELVCSNSLGSNLIDRPSGLLKEEARRMGSMLLACADETALPAGGALAVDRAGFARRVTERISAHPKIDIIRAEATEIPAGPAIIASGPLTSAPLAGAIQRLTGADSLFFFDAIAPIVTRDSINMDIAYRASRFGVGDQSEGDYINCPFTDEQYEQFVAALKDAERIPLREFEQMIQSGVKAGSSEFFEGCLPVEILAARGPLVLVFGPMRPIGLRNPRTGRWPRAVAQLRQDNLAGDLYNLVGFQTNLTFAEQKRVFRMIPGLEQAEFARFGQMHRNTFLAAPILLRPTLQFRDRDDLFFAGQITGVEGYMGNIATGLLAGLNAACVLQGEAPLELPRSTMLGALCHYISHAELAEFQPMKANFGLLPELEVRRKTKLERSAAYSERALNDLDQILQIHTPIDNRMVP